MHGFVVSAFLNSLFFQEVARLTVSTCVASRFVDPTLNLLLALETAVLSQTGFFAPFSGFEGLVVKFALGHLKQHIDRTSLEHLVAPVVQVCHQCLRICRSFVDPLLQILGHGFFALIGY